MKHDYLLKSLKPYISIDQEKYKALEPTLLKINSLFEDGILKKELYKNFTEDFSDISFFLQVLRGEYTKKFGFFLISEDFLSTTSNFLKNKKVLEVGAGTGFLSYCLQKNEVNVTPIDLKIKKNLYGFEKTYTNILEEEAVKHLKKNNDYDTIIMSWPNYQTKFAQDVLSNMNIGQTLIYIGEGYGGCTADDNFFDLLAEKCEIQTAITDDIQKNSYSWPCIHDKVEVYTIKK